jgi:RING finger/CHY zinc finger protein 1
MRALAPLFAENEAGTTAPAPELPELRGAAWKPLSLEAMLISRISQGRVAIEEMEAVLGADFEVLNRYVEQAYASFPGGAEALMRAAGFAPRGEDAADAEAGPHDGQSPSQSSSPSSSSLSAPGAPLIIPPEPTTLSAIEAVANLTAPTISDDAGMQPHETPAVTAEALPRREANSGLAAARGDASPRYSLVSSNSGSQLYDATGSSLSTARSASTHRSSSSPLSTSRSGGALPYPPNSVVPPAVLGVTANLPSRDEIMDGARISPTAPPDVSLLAEAVALYRAAGGEAEGSLDSEASLDSDSDVSAFEPAPSGRTRPYEDFTGFTSGYMARLAGNSARLPGFDMLPMSGGAADANANVDADGEPLELASGMVASVPPLLSESSSEGLVPATDDLAADDLAADQLDLDEASMGEYSSSISNTDTPTPSDDAAMEGDFGLESSDIDGDGDGDFEDIAEPDLSLLSIPRLPLPPKARLLVVTYLEKHRGCPHYLRGAALVCPDCPGNEAATDLDLGPNGAVSVLNLPPYLHVCRVCHDGLSSVPSTGPSAGCAGGTAPTALDVRSRSMPEHPNHELPRPRVQKMVCLACGKLQPYAGTCVRCGNVAGDYCCKHCHMLDSGPGKHIFHCDKCSLCRIGRSDAYFHCDTCGGCFALSTKPTHKCTQGQFKADCPFCLESIFSSRTQAVTAPCGHMMHAVCQQRAISQGRCTCPLCNRLLLADEQRASWESWFAESIRTQPMPPQFSRRIVEVLCNECSHRFEHSLNFVGYACPKCGTHNTR